MGDAISICANPAVEGDTLPDARKRGQFLLSDQYDASRGGEANSGRGVNQQPAVNPQSAYRSASQHRGHAPSPIPDSSTAYQQPSISQQPSMASTPSVPTNNESSTSGLFSAVSGILLGSSSGDWDPASFLKQLQEAKMSGNKHIEKKVLQQVAENNYTLRKKWKVPRTIAITADRCASTQVPGKGRDPIISFSTLSTGDAILAMSKNPQRRICALNFANGEQVGGGYKTGATAQEEDLCRRIPTLYTTLLNASKAGLYPFGPCTLVSIASPGKYSDVLVTRGLVVARGSVEQGYALLGRNEEATVALVTAAAPNINFAKEVSNPELMYKTIKAIFVAPRIEDSGLNTLILGAWGCGAFGGNPKEISELFARALKENLGRLYDEIHFAIPEGRNAESFRRTLQQHNFNFTELRA